MVHCKTSALHVRHPLIHQGKEHLFNLLAKIIVVQILPTELLVLRHAPQHNAHDICIIDNFEKVKRILHPQYHLLICWNYTKHKGGMVSMTHRPCDEDFKKSIVALYQNGKTQSQLSKEYGVSLSAIGKWIRLYSEVKTVDGDIMTAKQIKDLQRRNAQLEEENLILKKAIAIFTPHSNND